MQQEISENRIKILKNFKTKKCKNPVHYIEDGDDEYFMQKEKNNC